MIRRKQIARSTALLVGGLLAAMTGLRCGAESVQSCTELHRHAATSPDYSGIVIACNMAPLNLRILESGDWFCLRLSGSRGSPIESFSTSGNVHLPQKAWHELIGANSGGELRVDIYVKREGRWNHFDTVRNRISRDEIDPYVVYRFIPPVYKVWGRMSLRQRDLRSFEERIVFDNERSTDPDGSSVEGDCIHCHTFLNRGTDRMLLHVRPGRRKSQIPALILVRDGHAEKLDTRAGQAPAAYTSWNPNGKLLAFSRNSLSQIFHTAGAEVREVIDKDSDLAFYGVDTGRAYTIPQVSRQDRLETFPSWSADGRYLYFCSAPILWTDRKGIPLEQYDKVQYDLNRVGYDPVADRWGEVETVISAAELGRSISLPQVSPDGRFLMFCAHDYGSFPVYQPGSDLYMLDLNTIESATVHIPGTGTQSQRRRHGKADHGARRLDEINSNQSDSYHSWSSNGRWVIFASKREDGVFARFYISHLESDGRFSKPFVMPQEDPDFYGRCLMTFNRPEFVRQPVTVSATELARAMNSSARSPVAAPRSERSTVAADEPWQSQR